ncbi:substrate-binding domain-containing protein [Paenibacillus crassostreae]|uniref:HTH lacI-type domain-containing protein n=1 Tax=Paenibacillus crassostreae TaxID=1763538 RepID=A0A162RI42_9BACL|nr:substrate-binding domain-containing protein [Paenibacillus crassostreae]AOZ92904.1 hypothetical protein LPB68_12215 [Paenibacillus crassostreae]OAB72007.1 hypothetical protein PNBC_18680 [Paenibacillus crassostreae]
MVTIKDIAKMAGVSAMTVSNVIHNRETKTSEMTRNTILELIHKHNYKPNMFARNLVIGKSKIIGLLIPNVSNPFYSTLIRVVEDAANQAGYGVFLCNTHNNMGLELNYIRIMKENCVDGLIVASSTINNTDYYNTLARESFPVVIMDRLIRDEEDVYSVISDDFKGSYTAVQHLIEKGHRRIGCIVGTLTTLNSSERLRGYNEAMLDQKLPIESSWVHTGNDSLEMGATATDVLLKSKVTAIMTCNDILAYGVYRKASELKLHIPLDLSVIGFSDISFSEIITPPLTTVRLPILEMGIQATELLFGLLDHKTWNQKTFSYQTNFIIRESTAQPSSTSR